MSWPRWFGRRNIREQNIVLKTNDDVYSLLTETLGSIEELHVKVRHLNERLDVLIPPDVTPGDLKNHLENLRAYVHFTNSQVGGLVQEIPDPPAGLTGRRRGA